MPLLGAVAEDPVERKEYLAFRLADEVYAIDIPRIGEILRIPPVTPVPRAPGQVMGIIGVRGRVLSVLDLRARLGLPCLPPTRHARVLVLPWSETEKVGLYVDEVLQVHRFSDDEIEPAARALGSDVGEHVAGIARVDNDLVVVVHLEPFLEV
jgi:purine-binding chemotaxis protein CheW